MALVPFNEHGPFHLLKKPSRTFIINNEKVTINQDWDNSGVAAVVWDASLVLSLFLCNVVGKDLKGKRVLELGAGTGVVGIIAARLGASVTLTDKEEFVHITKSNALENLTNNESFSVKPLDWGNDLDKWSSETWDYVVGADIIYIEDTFNDLLETLKLLARNKSTKVYLGCRIRYARDTKFLDILKKHFNVTLVHYDNEKDIKVFEAVRSFKTDFIENVEL